MLAAQPSQEFPQPRTNAMTTARHFVGLSAMRLAVRVLSARTPVPGGFVAGLLQTCSRPRAAPEEDLTALQLAFMRAHSAEKVGTEP